MTAASRAEAPASKYRKKKRTTHRLQRPRKRVNKKICCQLNNFHKTDNSMCNHLGKCRQFRKSIKSGIEWHRI